MVRVDLDERRTASTAFLREYEELLLTYGTDYKEVRHERTTAIIHEFFAPAAYEERVFDLRQQFDYEGTAGRLLSSSYAPLEGHPNYVPMMRELERIYRAHARKIWWSSNTTRGVLRQVGRSAEFVIGDL